MRKVLTDQEKGEQEEKGDKVATRLASSSHQLQLLPNLPTRETEQLHPQQASPLIPSLTLLWTKTSRLLLARLTRIVEHFHCPLASAGILWLHCVWGSSSSTIWQRVSGPPGPEPSLPVANLPNQTKPNPANGRTKPLQRGASRIQTWQIMSQIGPQPFWKQ